MLKQIFIATIIGSAAVLSGCGEPYRSEAVLYIQAAQTALISEGICSSNADCSHKKLLFWNDGEYFLDVLPKDVTFVNLYNTQDPVVVNAVVIELKQAQTRISKPGVVLTVYKSKHMEPVVKFQRIEIK